MQSNNTSSKFRAIVLIFLSASLSSACSKNETSTERGVSSNNQNLSLSGLAITSSSSIAGGAIPAPSFNNMMVVDPRDVVGEILSEPAVLCSSPSDCAQLPSIAFLPGDHPSNKAILIAHAGNATCSIPLTKNKGETDQAFKARRLAAFKQMPIYDGRTSAADPEPSAVNYFAKARQTFSDQGVPDSQVSWLVSCFGYLPDLSVELYYVSSADPTNVLTTTKESMSDVVQSLNSGNGPAYIYIIGHSYGGTLAMMSADKLATNDAANVSLITLDTIGFGCTLAAATDPDCTRFPLAPNASTLRRKMSGTWENYYQTDAKMTTILGTYALKSNVVPGVAFSSPNVQDRIVWRLKNSDAIVTDVSAHIAMQTLDRAWNSLFAQIVADYPKQLRCDVHANDGTPIRTDICSSGQICGSTPQFPLSRYCCTLGANNDCIQPVATVAPPIQPVAPSLPNTGCDPQAQASACGTEGYRSALPHLFGD